MCRKGTTGQSFIYVVNLYLQEVITYRLIRLFSLLGSVLLHRNLSSKESKSILIATTLAYGVVCDRFDLCTRYILIKVAMDEVLTSKVIGIACIGASTTDSGDEERTKLDEYSSLSKSFLPDDKVICNEY